MSGNAKMQSPSEEQSKYDNLLKLYCRLKPVRSYDSCFSVLSSNILCTEPVDQLQAPSKQLQFSFSKVFPSDSTQKELFDNVALPLVHKVLLGHNCVLFSYGNTGSGKTYTMKGTVKDGGIMPRCLDVIFNSLSHKMARKHTFKSDRSNGYRIQTEEEIAADSNKGLLKQISNKGHKVKVVKSNSDPDLAGRFVDPTQVSLDSRNKFSIFITFVEIYNNNVYDLLDDSLGISDKPPSSKLIREDSKKNMFIQGVTEVEVESTEEAYEVFYRGLKRRRVAETLLNAQSSRSHSVFNIKVVQANLSSHNNLFNMKMMSHRTESSHITVGQLSLVDLAGSERCSRTHNTGKVLAEAGNINSSLMTLRQCFEAIKENQRGGSRMVPYRESKLTTLFKNYFEGDGSVSMIICINPHKDDYNESLHVLKFAESSQEIHFGLSVNKQHEQEEAHQKRIIEVKMEEYDAVMKLKYESIVKEAYLKCDNIKSLLSSTEIPSNFHSVTELKEALFTFKRNIATVINQVSQPYVCEDVWLEWIAPLRREYRARLEIDLLKNQLKRKLMESENALKKTKKELSSAKSKLEESENNSKRLKIELMEKEKAVMRAKVEKDREKEKMMSKRLADKEHFSSEVYKLKKLHTELKLENQNKDMRLAKVQRVLSDEVLSTSSTPSFASTRAKFEKIATPSSVFSTPRAPHSEVRSTARRCNNMAVSNRRHRRSRSTGDVWLEHKPAMPVPLNTVLQPSLPKRKSITKLTDAKQVTQGASKYCLMTQTQDSDGDLETRIYKADVVPTSGGGAQVTFNDVEVLKQISPDASPSRKRKSPEERDPGATCSYGIEGHNLRKRLFK